jgi:hypothetical protein
MKLKPIDATGKRIKVGDTVRVVGIPDLSSMAPKERNESRRVFEYLVGKYKRVREFNQFGLVWLDFAIRKGPSRGFHGVAIEPNLLRARRSNGKKRI